MGNRVIKKWSIGHWEKSHYISSGKRGYWSKYGDPIEWKEKPAEEVWYCQTCKKQQFSIIPIFEIPFDNNEQVKVCPFCKYLSLVNEAGKYTDLIEIIFPVRGLGNAIANLLSLPLPY